MSSARTTRPTVSAGLEQCKDGTKMGVGCPEYVLLFRKPQTDRTRGYADLPVAKSKTEYTCAHWQVDAHAFWRSSGNRQLTAEEMASYGPAKLAKLFTEYSMANVYDYEFHVRIGEELEALGALPSPSCRWHRAAMIRAYGMTLTAC